MQSCKDLSCNQYVGSRWTQCLSQESVQTQTGCIVMLKSKCKEFPFLSKTLLKMSFWGEKSLYGVFFKTTSCYVSTGEVLWSCLEPYIKPTNTQTCVVNLCCLLFCLFKLLSISSSSVSVCSVASISVSLSSISTTTYRRGGGDDATRTNSGVSVCFRAARSTTKG